MLDHFAVFLIVLAVVAAAAAILLLPRLRRTPAPAVQANGEAACNLASPDAVMRALTLVQQQYAALMRQHDIALARIRELGDENERLRSRQ